MDWRYVAIVVGAILVTGVSIWLYTKMYKSDRDL
jgi:cell division protein FtsL